MPRHIRVRDNEPRYEMITTRYPADVTEIVFAQFATQAETLNEADEALNEMLPLFKGVAEPTVADRGHYTDASNYANATIMAYWFSSAAFDEWLARADVDGYWSSRPTTGKIGYYREVGTVPPDYMETDFGPSDPKEWDLSGTGPHLETYITPTHDYWGSARDRLGASAYDELEGEIFEYEPTTTETLGRHIALDMPGNACLIRTAQDWKSSKLFLERYFEQIEPIKDAGVDYLAVNPHTGCIQSRKIAELTIDGHEIERSSTVAWFLSLEHLLVWTRAHQSHLRIYGAFFRMLESPDGDNYDLPLWHEVTVVPKGNGTAEYFNCHNRTGFLTVLDNLNSPPVTA